MMEIRIPKISAEDGEISPAGIGLSAVLDIRGSISLSYHIFIAPEAPAPIDMHKTDRKKKKGCNDIGANITPQIDVNTASDMTLGFNKAIKSLRELLSFDISLELYLMSLACNTSLRL